MLRSVRARIAVAALIPVIAVVWLVSAAAARQGSADTPRLEILSASLLRGVDVAAWFGGASDPTLQLTVQNSTDTVVRDQLPAVWIDGEVFFGERIDALQAGERTTVDVVLHLDSFQWGRVRMTAVVGQDEYVVRPWNIPWALLAMAALAVHLVVLRLRNRLRSRVAAEAAAARTAVGADVAGAETAAEGSSAVGADPGTTSASRRGRGVLPLPEPRFAPDGRALPASADALRSVARSLRPSPYDEDWSADPWATGAEAPPEPATSQAQQPWAHDGSTAGETDPWHRDTSEVAGTR